MCRNPVTSWEILDSGKFFKDTNFIHAEQYYKYRIKKAPNFFISDDQVKKAKKFFSCWDTSTKNPVKAASTISKGTFTFFSYHQFKLGMPPNWFYDPFNNYHHPRNSHWSEIQEFNHKDIKNIWELNRFGFVFTLVRAYFRTGEEQYARVFWKLVEDWQRQNQPNQGPNWKCGQEITFRVIAWCFGLYGFRKSKESTSQRLMRLSKMIAVSGIRIESNLKYALSQKNNHSISEAVGLYTIGILFPEFTKAEHWRKIGKKLLEKLGQQLIYEDGSFAQHSVNYHRLLLHTYLWTLRLGDINNDPFSPELKERLLDACLFIFHLQDRNSGNTPNYGQNDGALILPLNNCEYHDFRPVVQAVYFLLTGKRCFKTGSWDEDLYWFFGESALTARVDRIGEKNLSAEEGGYYTMSTSESWLFIRCASFRHRPSQADMLHMDLFWKGQNIVVDPGTYSYHADKPWNNPFAETGYHNTVSIDGRDQMERINKFMWLPWIRGRVLRNQFSPSGRIQLWKGEHNGFQRLKQPVSYIRTILKLGEAMWLVLDCLYSQSRHDYRLHWLLTQVPYIFSQKNKSLTLNTPKGEYHIFTGEISELSDISIESADKTSPRGWRSQYYNQKEAALSLLLYKKAEQAVFYTWFSPNSAIITSDENSIAIEEENIEIAVAIGSEEHHPVSEISVQGQYEEIWKPE